MREGGRKARKVRMSVCRCGLKVNGTKWVMKFLLTQGAGLRTK